MNGFARAGPVAFSDPVGLHQNSTGNERECLATWARRHDEDEERDAVTMAAARALAIRADVDLHISDGRRNPRRDGADSRRQKPRSRHNSGLAFDISAIGTEGEIFDVGQGSYANAAAMALVITVQAAALGMSHVSENFGPGGLFRRGSSGGAIVTSWARGRTRKEWRLSWDHEDHIHISVFR